MRQGVARRLSTWCIGARWSVVLMIVCLASCQTPEISAPHTKALLDRLRQDAEKKAAEQGAAGQKATRNATPTDARFPEIRRSAGLDVPAEQPPHSLARRLEAPRSSSERVEQAGYVSIESDPAPSQQTSTSPIRLAEHLVEIPSMEPENLSLDIGQTARRIGPPPTWRNSIQQPQGHLLEPRNSVGRHTELLPETRLAQRPMSPTDPFSTAPAAEQPADRSTPPAALPAERSTQNDSLSEQPQSGLTEAGAPRTEHTLSPAADPAPPAKQAAPPAPAVPDQLPDKLTVGLAGSLPPNAVQVDSTTGAVTVMVRNAPLAIVLSELARLHGLNLITTEDITAQITVTLRGLPLAEALTQLLSASGYTCVQRNNVLVVSKVSADRTLPPEVQGRIVRLFELDYVTAEDIDLVVKGLLSPAGQSFPTTSMEDDNRKTQETLVVEDLPDYLERVEQYIAQADHPPRQVLIEAHILAVELEDNAKHGVNFEYLDRGNPSLTLKTQGFATTPAANSPAFLFNLSASNLNLLLEALQTTTDAKMLANPKVLVLNGQKAQIQIGEKLGYRITTTTQTSTMESVEFLDVGVVLEVTPRITQDGHVVMDVKPKVSTGEIDSVTQLPDEETTEVETSIMLPDGRGLVIGGLIQESETEVQSKIPVVGDLWLIGRLFQRRELKRKRTEIIIALVPHIVPYQPGTDQRECDQFRRATKPLVYGDLRENPRPSEPRFTDAGQKLSLLYKTQKLRPLHEGLCWGPPFDNKAPCPETDMPAAEYYRGGMAYGNGSEGAGRVIRSARIPFPSTRGGNSSTSAAKRPIVSSR